MSAPSGAGKSSLLNALINEFKEHAICASISHTTRAPRPREQEGVHYFFTTVDDFKKDICNNKFIEYAEVFGNYYGTSYEFIFNKLNEGVDVFLDIDWQGARQIRAVFPYAKSIFILPPSIKSLEDRLRSRNQDSEETIKFRMQKATYEVQHCNDYDYLIINDDFNQSVQELKNIVLAGRNFSHIQRHVHQDLIKSLIKEANNDNNYSR